MASNPTPDNNAILRALADRLADGCHVHEVALGIKQNTEVKIRADIASLLQASTVVGLKKQDLDTAFEGLAAADTAASTLLNTCKLVLRAKLGERWNAAWEATGFPDQSTALPRTQDERFALLAALQNYFTTVPTSANADLGATAAACGAAWEVFSDARQAVGAAESAQATAIRGRTVAEDALRARVRGLINELEQLLPTDDPRWEEFGLNIPGNPSAPEPVESVTVVPASNHRLEVSWPYAVRAIRYRVETFIVGEDTDWVNKGSAKDLEIILKGFTAGQVVKVRIVAGNDGGDAAPCPETQITVS